uniref:PEP-utilising enzyme mobile domain-containing protein n=1 Tax=Caulobacter phage BL57 TaxID=3348355 RepID=A0AB74UIL5_9VIRU
MAETMSLSFRIEGAALVERARDRVIEGNWEHGLRILVEGLHGMSYELAIDILLGKHTLGGWSSDPEGVYLTDQDQTDPAFLRYKETLDYQFAGVLKLEDGRIMRPYAVVDSFSKIDFDSKVRFLRLAQGSDPVFSRPKRFHDTRAEINGEEIDWAYRALHYADEPTQDIVRLVRMEGFHPTIRAAVLFKEVRDYPKLLLPKVETDAQKAVDAAVKAQRGLSKRGHVYEYGAGQDFDQEHYKTTMGIDQVPTAWSVRNPKYVDPDAKLVKDTLAEIDARKPTGDHVTAMNRMIKDEVDGGMSISTAVDVARAKMALMGGMAEDPEQRLRAINDAYAAKYERAEGRSVEDYRKAILAQAGDDFFDLAYTDVEGKEVVLKVPTAPFEQWALWRTAGAHLAKPWKRVTYTGFKMFGDDPYHTDWVLGAGLNPEDWPIVESDNPPLHKAAWDKRFQLAEEKLGGNMRVLLGKGYVTGKIVMLKPGETLSPGEIGVIRNAGPDYVQAAQSAIEHNTALICENGGSVAHLVVEYLDKPLRLTRIENARKIFKDGMTVYLDFDKSTREIAKGGLGPSPADLGLDTEWEIEQ